MGDVYGLSIAVLLAVAVLVCLTTKTPSAPQSLYDKLSPDLETAIRQLKTLAIKARRVVPSFPPFPDVYPPLPADKGACSSRGERYCIQVLEALFPGYTFSKVRPPWLKNPKTGRALELDGYCPELKIAVEYNGIQHYRWPNYLHTPLKDFVRQRERDKIKEELCRANNVCLLRIPYTVPLERIPLAVYAKLLEAIPADLSGV